MYGWAKIISEDSRYLRIGYSYGDDDVCDGILLHDKSTKETMIEKLSSTTTERLAKWMCCPIMACHMHGRLKNTLTFIATG